MKVFISYRREDSAGYTGRLFDSLRGRIGNDNLFFDLSAIDSGQNYAEVIQGAIHSCDVLLAIIGPEWLTCEANGRRRLDDPTDLVRSEIRTALERHIPVIPVRVGGAGAPAAAALPPPLQPLATRDAHELTDERWEYDVDRLIAAMRRIAAPRQRPPARAWMLAAAALVIGIAVIAAFVWPRLTATSPGDDVEARTAATLRVEGMWAGEVKYEWGATYTERFEFVVDGTELTGTASFLGVPRAFVTGNVEGDRLTFETRTQEVGAETRDVRHRYRGRIAGDAIELSMQSLGGSSNALTAFTIKRTEPPSR